MSFSNGRAVLGVDVVLIPQSDSIQTNGDQYIAREALPYLQRAAAEFFERTGIPVWLEEVYRSYETQVRIFTARYERLVSWIVGAVWWDGSWWRKRAGQSTAAVPGTSKHGLGLAIDAWSGINVSFTHPRHLIWLAVATVLGWLNTGVDFEEPWHQEFSLARVQTTIIGAGTGPTTPLEEDDMYTEDDRKRDVKAAADAAAARANSNQANERALKALEEVRAFAAGVGALVWGYKFSSPVDDKIRSASEVARTGFSRIRAIYKGTAPTKEK